MNLQVKHHKEKNVLIWVSEEGREKLKHLAKLNHRGVRGQLDFLITQAYKKLK